MTYHNVSLPDSFAYRTRGGPGHKTDIIVLANGQEQRSTLWSGSRRTYVIEYRNRDHTFIGELNSFVLARSGATYAFKFKDFHDCTSAATHIATELDGTASANDDVTLGTGDGSDTQFQLIKRYASGGVTKTRVITKPVSGTVLIAVDSASKIEGVDYTVNYETGVVTFTTAPGSGLNVTAGFEFETVGRFGEDVDEALESSIADPGNSEVRSIDIIEITETDVVTGEDTYGGSDTLTLGAAPTTITALDGRLLVMTSDAADRQLWLPDTTTMPGGGPYFHLVNDGSYNIKVYDSAGNFLWDCATGDFQTVCFEKQTNQWFMGC